MTVSQQWRETQQTSWNQGVGPRATTKEDERKRRELFRNKGIPITKLIQKKNWPEETQQVPTSGGSGGTTTLSETDGSITRLQSTGVSCTLTRQSTGVTSGYTPFNQPAGSKEKKKEKKRREGRAWGHFQGRGKLLQEQMAACIVGEGCGMSADSQQPP